jgi:hypothetical protein
VEATGKDVLNVNSELNMINSEVLEKMREQYARAKTLAKKHWEDGDHEGDVDEQYYFEAGFIAGLSCGLKQNLEKK